MSKDKPLRIRSSTAEFLIFTRQAGEVSTEVRVAEETVWLTQKLRAALLRRAEQGHACPRMNPGSRFSPPPHQCGIHMAVTNAPLFHRLRVER
jgi:hypothetical protein